MMRILQIIALLAIIAMALFYIVTVVNGNEMPGVAGALRSFFGK
jgi:hypothetical protein